MRRLALLLLVVLVSPACGTPPDKEYNQAVGAIEAARAAGAGTYAPEELASAEQALSRYAEAVAQRDYRQALSHALDSRERATAAAAKAASDKANLRGETERLIPVLAADMQRGRVALASATRAQADAARTLRETITATERALQETRAALERDNVKAARDLLTGLQERMTQALAPFQTTADPAPRLRR
ncbi:MAG: DUF4398 domain-containing protein [Acidobacteriota bacterium]|nr:DUF4398 domain-containing protein [Acidobacteriota bacterium]